MRFLLLAAPALAAALAAPGAAAQPLFRDVTATHLPPTASVSRNSMDVEAADLDGDGDLDLVVPQEFARNKLLLGDGAGGFTNGSAGLPPVPASEVSPPGPPAHDSEDVSIVDFDADGHLDLLIVSEDDVTMGRVNVHEYYRGHGDGTFERVYGEVPDTEANAVAHADVDADGDLDVLVAGGGQDRLLLNDGAGGFTDVTAQRLPVEGVTGQDAEFVDVDADGDPDLVIGYEGGHGLWINTRDSATGEAVFVDETAARLPDPGNVEARKVTPVDLDADGDLDLYFSHVGWEGRAPQDHLYLNDGTGHFSDVTAERLPAESLTSVDAKFADLDGDGDLDLVQVNLGPLVIYRNDGAGRFSDATASVLPAPVVGPGLGVEIADYNRDGYPDLYVAQLRNADPGAFDRLLLHVGAGTGTEGGTGEARGPRLHTPRPNPARGGARVGFVLDRPGPVRLALLDALGREVAVLVDGEMPPGAHEAPLPAGALPCGAYLLRMEAGGHRLARPFAVAR
jgi:hypothetical protein